jgi:alpha-L-fucosidase 2
MMPAEKNPSEMTLRYGKPAGAWNEALPLGNGRLGAMVFGGIEVERLALNEESLWHGGPVDRINPDAGKNFKAVRDLVRQGRAAEAEKLALTALAGTPEGQGHYVPLGDLQLFFDHGQEPIPRYLEVIGKSEIHARFERKEQPSGYGRSLDLETAISRVEYTIGGVEFIRETLASAADQVIAIRIRASQRGALSFRARLSRQAYAGRSGKRGDDAVFMAGNCGGPGGADYACVVAARTEDGGSVSTVGIPLSSPERPRPPCSSPPQARSGKAIPWRRAKNRSGQPRPKPGTASRNTTSRITAACSPA